MCIIKKIIKTGMVIAISIKGGIVISQQVIYNILNKDKKWYNSSELAILLGVNRNSINNNLKAMVKFGMIELRTQKINRYKNYTYRVVK